ncbi:MULTISPECIES: glycosyl transferase [Leptolyngbya]|uniref:glycosyl transferase n=1 Tax=Leptolyngbya TaxID=47251 RepID=UPI0016877B61|nr:glycosyl transferase [Leptolyngbya sp. FACHB-1624]MBD1855425.1 glycosyl transferase [Leptolyngbya sp. FACHB-1624]
MNQSTQLIHNSISSVAKNLQLGRVLYWSYYVPKGMIQRSLKRNPIRRWGDGRAQAQMERTAYHLPPLTPSSNPDKLYFLSGRRFWYQTCFCAYSMVTRSGVYFRPVIYNDGTLSQPFQDEIRRIFPDAEIIDTEIIEDQLDQALPTQTFPTLRSRRLEYFNLRKLTDIHAGSQGWKLVLDSDMLFFRRPDFLLDWLKAPENPCYMVDIDNAYGYSDALMTQLARAAIPDRVNVGICGLNSTSIDWEELEYWCKTLIDTEGTNYYQEQALTAMLIARFPNEIAPEKEYVLMPNRSEVQTPQAVMHHYVADSKFWYFRYGWQQIVPTKVA